MPADGKRKNGDIYVAGSQTFQEDGRDLLDDRNMRLGKFPGEADELRWQKVRRDCGDDAKAE